MQFDMTELCRLIDDKFKSRRDCALLANIEPSTLSRALNGSGNLKASQIRSLAKVLEIDPMRMDSVFFTEKVAKKQP